VDLLQLLLHLNQFLGALIAQHGELAYVVLFAIVFSEIGLLPLFFLPGDPLLFFCGAFCATGALSLGLLLPLLFAAAVLGTLLSYGLGRALGERAHARNYRWLDREALDRAHAFYERYGRVTFLMSPFIAVVRTFAPFAAGVSGMTFSRFLPAVVAGAALWVGILVMGGYYFGNIPFVRDHVGGIVLLGLALGLLSLVLGSLLRKRRQVPPGELP
jgi:membrane-associated protein